MAALRRTSIATLACVGVFAGVHMNGSVPLTSTNARWAVPIVMNLELGGSNGPLSDGCADWGQCAENALTLWSPYLAGVQLRAVRNATVPQLDHDGVNVMYFANDIYGQAFGSRTLAATKVWSIGSTITDADVIFNKGFGWDSYRGTLRPGIHDFRRIAAHEFGHVLGLSHPDEAGQNVAALMNSSESNIEVPQNDDVSGVTLLYGAAAVAAINFPPRTDAVDFGNQLEGKYQNTLHRAPSSSYVDVEGSVVWMQEYLRYRVNQCAHADAVSRVFMQVGGQGIQPVCGVAASATFPPRNESVDFGAQLNAYYRDTLRRAPLSSYVDVEGTAVWVQEYLRLRVGGCAHASATQSVFAEIDGTAAVCR